MFSLLGTGELKKRILPGSEKVISNSESTSFLTPLSNQEYFGDDRNYVNAGLEEYEAENQKYKEFSKTAIPGSSMSCVDSTNYEGSVADLKDLDVDQIKLFENYRFKDPSDVSNNLEIAKFKYDIVQAVNSNSTVLITGVTGCGKSTQVPQFILDDCMNRKKNCNIIVTQPRRIAAISVSRQVNKERGWKNGLLVGYQVGRKKDYDPNTTKILYCTTGILLQKIIKAKSLSEFTHIILDEVHERSLEMDFLLLVIKKLLKTRNQSTHIILMSATAETIKLGEYFQEYYGPPQNKYVCPPIIEVSKTYNHNISKFHLDNLYAIIPSARRMNFDKPQIDEAGYETAICLVKEFDHLEKNGEQRSSVLIFLPGIFEIEEMYQRLENLMASEHHRWILVPLHSSITNEEQVRVFEKAPSNFRKIILSTNIAESSITVPDVSYVIDFCLMKQIRNELRSNYSMLVLTWASKSNCEQRAGRVGRVADGRVYRLVPKNMFKEFDDNELPEMSRCSLSRIILMSKILDMGTPKQLLASALDPPGLNNIVLTILTLKQVGALLPTINGIISSVDGDITFLGKVMAYLPIEPPMSKLIYFGHIFNILYEALVMACGLSVKSIFSQPFNKHLEAYTQKLTWANYSSSDPIAYIGPYRDWLEHKPVFDRNRSLENSWAKENFIQLAAIRELYDLIDDITHRLRTNFNITLNSGKMKWNNPTEKAMACKVILAGAFYPNYFIRGISNSYMDEYEVLKILDKHDPNKTVYFTGFPNDQPKELYKEALENMFPSKFVGKPTAYFSTSNKVYIEFPSSNSINMMNSNHDELNLVPGNICFGVYVAMKMHQLKLDFKIPLLRPLEAKQIVERFKQRAIQENSKQKILPIERCVLDDFESDIKTMDITVSYFKSIDCFWAQPYDEHYKNVLFKVWKFINSHIHISSANRNNLKIGDFLIVTYQEENYRAKLINFGDQENYQFFLIDFGEYVDLKIENIYEISNENDKNEVYNVPPLAFQCKIANISPKVHGKQKNNSWSNDANNLFLKYGVYLELLKGTVHSIVNNVVSFEDLKYQEEEKSISIPESLIKNKLAVQSGDFRASKIDLEKKSEVVVSNSKKFSEMSLQLKSPTEAQAYTMHRLKGPFTPLEMSVHGINRSSTSKLIKIESQSVNSVLLDTNPNEYHERLFVAGNVCINNNEKLILWDTTMMPNIPGMPAIICLMFAPCVEIRYNPSFTKMIGAICGLGYDPETSRPLFADNDIEIVFDTVMDLNFLNEINVIRMLLNKCVNPEDEEGPGDIFQIQHKLQETLLNLLSHPLKLKAPEYLPRKYMWSSIPKTLLKTPFLENCPFDHPMGGSDVYKLLWGVNFSQVMSNGECKELLYKLCKIKRLEKESAYDNYSSDRSSEELLCPLCQLTFSNNTSMRKHLQNDQHIERYIHAKEELLRFYKGPFSDLQNL